jgi:hypothetical protein
MHFRVQLKYLSVPCNREEFYHVVHHSRILHFKDLSANNIVMYGFTSSPLWNYEINIKYESDTPVVSAVGFKLLINGYYHIPTFDVYNLD